jgi:long-chain acyl-CoA synthetase
MGEYLAKEELYLAFLPQAHILEFVVEMAFITIGLPIAYGRLKTLTDAGVHGCKNDIQESRPVSSRVTLEVGGVTHNCSHLW